mgnify:CR=1 FL=1
MKPIEAIVYDLDNTIYPAKKFCEPVFLQVIDAIFSADNNSYLELELEKIKADMFTTTFVDVAKKYSLSDETILAVRQVLDSAVFEEQLVAYEDCAIIENIPLKSFLVTSGNTSFQNKKIENLRIAHWFEKIYIDDENAQPRIGKEGVFKQILSDLGCDAEQVIVVGDNISSEIAAGNKLGMHTIQILRAGIQKGAEAKQHINSFTELFNILNLQDTSIGE